MTPFKALIFDMNGTMIDDMHYHEIAWYDVLVNQLKAPLSKEELRHQLYGRADEMFVRIFGKGAFSREDIQRITDDKELRYREEYLSDLKLIPGLQEVLDSARAANIPMAIGTAAPIENVDFVLDTLNLRKYFKTIIGPADVAESKPHPDVFLLAARQLEISPEFCVVFEDAPKGIEAAERAGMKAVGITSFHTAEELNRKNVLFSIKDYEDERLKRYLADARR